MGYLVLARKFRPGRFSELIGQVHVAQTLKNAISSNRVAHAYIFAGPRGVGKTSAARILARAVNCLQVKQDDPEPCNECNICNEVIQGNSLDVVEIDGASNRGIDEIRSLREKVKYAPARNKYKIYIIDEVHMLTKESFNALLKTIEEPPEHVIFIFATTEPHNIPITILSRCQRYDFRRIPVKTIHAHLCSILKREEVEYEEKAILEIARNSGGSLRDSLSLLDQLIAFAQGKIGIEDVQQMLGLVRQTVFHDFLSSIKEGDREKGILLIHKIHEEGFDLVDFFKGFVEFLRNIMILKVSKNNKLDAIVDLTDQDVKDYRAAGEDLEQEALLSMIDLVVDMSRELKMSDYPQVLAEVLFLRLVDIRKGLNLKNVYLQVRKLKKAVIALRDGKKPSSSDPQPRKQTPPLKDTSADMVNKYMGDEKKNSESPQAELTLDLIRSRWGDLADHLASRKIPFLKTMNSFSGLTSFENDRLTITVSSKIFYQSLMQKMNLKMIDRELFSFFNRRISLHVVYNEDEKPEIPKPAEDPQSLNPDDVKILKKAKRIFGGNFVK